MRVPTSGAWDQRGQTGQQTVLAFFVTSSRGPTSSSLATTSGVRLFSWGVGSGRV